ncbi:FtsB family cell division protein [Rubrimonas sp.]|uniref:FtsB family cell division protein n=1 Tax=Rubrimonas sp. TaxID=2036015 RepID=UPI002FDE9502
MPEPEHEAGRLRLIDGAALLLVFVAVVNFAHYAIQGDYGVFALMEIEAERAALVEDLAALRAERAQLETLTAGLSASALDLDLLDERARAVLGLMRSDEIRLP